MIKIIDKYYLGADKYNWILYEKVRNKKTDEFEYSAIGFFGTLENLLEKLLQRKFKKLQGDFDDLKILTSNMSAERKKFAELSCRLCEGIKKEWLIKNDK